MSESSVRRLIAHVIPYRRRVKTVVSAPSSDVKLNRMSHSGSGDDEVTLSRTVDTDVVVLVFTIESPIGEPFVLCWVVVSVLFFFVRVAQEYVVACGIGRWMWVETGSVRAVSGGGCGWIPAACEQARDIYHSGNGRDWSQASVG